MQERLFTAYQVAELLGATPGVVAGWINDGKLVSHQMPGGAIRISERNLVKFLKAEGIDIKQVLAEAIAKQNSADPDTAAKNQYVSDGPDIAAEKTEEPSLGASVRYAVSEGEKAALHADLAADESSIMEALIETADPDESTEQISSALQQVEPQATSQIPAPADAPGRAKPILVGMPVDAAAKAAQKTQTPTKPEPAPAPKPTVQTKPEPAAQTKPAPAPAPEPAPKAEPKPEVQAQEPSHPAKTEERIAQYADEIIRSALHVGAAAVHIETDGKAISVRLRLNGTLQEDTHFKKHKSRTLGPDLTEHFMSLAELDCDLDRPQTGQFEISLGSKSVTVGISAVRTLRGRKLVLRPADSAASQPKLTRLGLSSAHTQTLSDLLARRHGLIILAAPPRNEIDQMLAAMVDRLSADTGSSIMMLSRYGTAPVEGASCCPCASSAGTRWSQGMAAGMELDTDVIIVGDIVDPETALAAVEASASALVIGVMRTRSAASAVATLTRMGAEPWMLASVLTAVIEQRVVRTLCDECKKATSPSAAALEALGVDSEEANRAIYSAGQCAKCGQSGYLGQELLLSIAEMDEGFAEMIRSSADEQAISEALLAQRPALLAEARELLKSGATTLDEIARAEL